MLAFLCIAGLLPMAMATGLASLAPSTSARHGLALDASALIYQLADLENADSGRKLVDGHRAFRQVTLRDYEARHYFADRRSGLKFVVFAPLQADDAWILALAGSETAIDWMSDLNLGRQQFAELRRRINMFLPLTARRWIVTGHSLGGGLAQALAVDLSHQSMEVELVTFNAFGAADLIAPSDLSEHAVGRILGANYFVTGDLVSRIGYHIGPTFELSSPSAEFARLGTIERHSLAVVKALVGGRTSYDFSRAVIAVPPAPLVLNRLKSLGGYFAFLTEEHASQLARRYTHLRVLEEAVDIAMTEKDSKALPYLRQLIFAFREELADEVQHDLRDQQIKALNRLLARLAVARS